MLTYAGKPSKDILILPNEQLIFFLSAKCDSTSVRRMALDGLGYRGPKEQDPLCSGLKYLKGPEDVLDYPDYVKVAVVRNPWDRLVSLYYDKVRRVLYRGLATLGVKKSMSFADFALYVCSIPDDETDPHLRSQTYFAFDALGNFLPEAVCRAESLEEDWERLRERVALREEDSGKPALVRLLPPLQRLNKGGTDMCPYWRLYEGRADGVQAVADRYQRDIETYGYEFGI